MLFLFSVAIAKMAALGSAATNAFTEKNVHQHMAVYSWCFVACAEPSRELFYSFFLIFILFVYILFSLVWCLRVRGFLK